MPISRSLDALGAAVCAVLFLAAASAGGVATSAVAASTTSGNNYRCEGGTGENNALVQSCTVTSSTGTCYERSTSPVVTQTCIFTQTAVSGEKHATATQIIESKDGAPLTAGSVEQNGTQTVEATQTGGSGSNFLTVSQVIEQKLGPGNLDDDEENELEPAGDPPSLTPIIQSQESHQYVTVTQEISSAAPNSSDISQFLKQRERASHAPSITQHQNLENRGTCNAFGDPDANMCVVVNQTSGGTNVSKLSEDYRQFQRAHDTLQGNQVQGNLTPFKGGENHDVHQTGSNPEQIITDQRERQTQRAVQTGILTQAQNGPRKGFGSSQVGTGADTWNGTMVSSQTQTNRPSAADIGTSVYAGAGTQWNDLEYYGSSTGAITANLTAVERSNGRPETVTNSCPAPDTPSNECAAVIVCSNASVDAPTQNESAACEANSCEPGQIFVPNEGCQSVESSLSAPAGATSVTPRK